MSYDLLRLSLCYLDLLPLPHHKVCVFLQNTLLLVWEWRISFTHTHTNKHTYYNKTHHNYTDRAIGQGLTPCWLYFNCVCLKTLIGTRLMEGSRTGRELAIVNIYILPGVFTPVGYFFYCACLITLIITSFIRRCLFSVSSITL